MNEYLAALIGLVIGVVIGNYGGDNNTIRDCVTKGSATMVNGVQIKCEAVRKP